MRPLMELLSDFGTILYRFLIILESFWRYFGKLLESFWSPGRSWEALGRSWGHPVRFWNNFGIISELFWNHVGSFLAPFWNLILIVFFEKVFWIDFCLILDRFWNRNGLILDLKNVPRAKE